MKTGKLILKSLLSNNACVDGGRKKAWYIAVIMFFLSIVMALVPLTVQTSKQKGTTMFENTTFGAREAFTEFAVELNKEEYQNSMYIIKGSEKKEKLLVGGNFQKYEHQNETLGRVDYVFMYDETINSEKYAAEIAGNRSVIYFSKNEVKMYIANPVDGTKVSEISCRDAYKKFNDGETLASNYKASEGNITKTVYDTWGEWCGDIDKLYNQTRARGILLNVGMFAIIDTVISLIMGLMIWIFTRGKRNPYSSQVNLWQGLKITAWTMVTPAILALGFGFLFKRLAVALFPLLLGIRAVWLSMKSFKLDGSGYIDTEK